MTSPQGMPPNPQSWSHNHSAAHINNKCNTQNSQGQLYQCSSECSDHSLKSHSQYSYSSQERSKNSSGSVCNGDGGNNGDRQLRHHNNHNHQQQQQHNNSHNRHHKHNQTRHCGNTNITNNSNVNGNIYENDEEISECERMISNNSINYQSVSEVDRHSECCSSAEDGDADTCCSCSESSCLYAEAIEPAALKQVEAVKTA